MTSLSKPIRTSRTLPALWRFLIVGMLGTCIDIALFALLHTWLGLVALVANVLAYSAGIVNNYYLHRHWTYAQVAQKATPVQAVQFAAVSLSALVVNTTLVLLLAQPFAMLLHAPDAGELLAKLCATGVGVGWNFLANHFWTFRDPSPKGAA